MDTAEQYEARAEECLRLARNCTDPATLETLRQRADEFKRLSGELRRQAAGKHETGHV
jgi:hypothetical protein